MGVFGLGGGGGVRVDLNEFFVKIHKKNGGGEGVGSGVVLWGGGGSGWMLVG